MTLSLSQQVLEELVSSLVSEVVAFLAGLVPFLGLEALQVLSAPGLEVAWSGPQAKDSPSAAVFPGAGTPAAAAAAKAAAKAAKYGECPLGWQVQGSGLPRSPWGSEIPVLCGWRVCL